MQSKRQFFGILVLTQLLLSGCQLGGGYAPVATIGQRGAVHQVVKGDTLYSIAFTYGIDFKRLAAANGIKPPYIIHPEQNIRLFIKGARKKKERQKIVAKRSSTNTRAATKSESQYSNINWRWPIDGKVVRGFALTGKINKGVDIRARLGESVNSAADGVVVYAGGGLRGYGKLVIVKHSDSFLSAYGHNRIILVKEGDKVKGGDIVAEIGSSGLNQQMLHFEIRRDGKPEDPMFYLPNRSGAL
ncbi:MAG: peptidoglycan DD-metalloendopeptidase family protein [Pseudomonadales bacterium]|nr:peptidoglycan DD-metalloendopeptidase family protein [Pseudomonadales bacterium]